MSTKPNEKIRSLDLHGCTLDEANKLIDFTKIQSFTTELSFNELLETYPKLLKGEYFGRAIVNPNK